MKPYEPEPEVPFSFPTNPGKEADEWGKKVLKESDKFVKKFGLGPCGPVADNIVDELQAGGRKARVMFTEFGFKNPITHKTSRFTHYVATELDDVGRVTKIYDPTNHYAKKPIIKLSKSAVNDPKRLLKEYFGADYEIFKKAGRSVDDGVFDKEMVDWWKGKLGIISRVRPVSWKPAGHELNPMNSVGGLANCVSVQKHFVGFEIKKPMVCRDYVRLDDGRWQLGGQDIGGNELDRLNGMRLPPGWKNVIASTDLRVKIQAIGMDKVGRWQYRYSAEHVAAAAQKKFNRAKLFSKDMPLIRKQIKKGIVDNDSRAFLLELENRTAIRAGSAADFRAKKKAYGLTTLQHEHVQIRGNKIILDFVAKEGIPAHYELTDTTLALWLKERKAVTSVGEKLFPDVSASRLNAYLKKISGKNYTVKDFRTYHGTRIAYEELKGYAGEALTNAQKKKIVKMVSEKVSEFLANTPAMAKKSYIDPMAWDFIGGL